MGYSWRRGGIGIRASFKNSWSLETMWVRVPPALLFFIQILCNRVYEMASHKVRFINNFIMSVIQTVEDGDGNLVVKEYDIHIQAGDIYDVEQYEMHPDGRVDIHFTDSRIAHNVESDYCELGPTNPTKPIVTKGCGSCGNK